MSQFRSIEVRYPIQTGTVNISPAEYDLVYDLYKRQEKVIAIRFIRNQYGLGLKEAKDVCDTISLTVRGTEESGYQQA